MNANEQINRDGDTVKLLRKCDAGVKMGISSIEDVESDIKSGALKNLLDDSKEQHKKLECEITEMLDDHNDDGKEPNPIAKSMSWIKTNMKMMASPSDSTIADLMTDGCHMGVKSLHKYLNQYTNADKTSKDIATRLITIETNLANDMASFL